MNPLSRAFFGICTFVALLCFTTKATAYWQTGQTVVQTAKSESKDDQWERASKENLSLLRQT